VQERVPSQTSVATTVAVGLGRVGSALLTVAEVALVAPLALLSLGGDTRQGGNGAYRPVVNNRPVLSPSRVLNVREKGDRMKGKDRNSGLSGYPKVFKRWLHDQKQQANKGAQENYDNDEIEELYKEWNQSGRPESKKETPSEKIKKYRESEASFLKDILKCMSEASDFNTKNEVALFVSNYDYEFVVDALFLEGFKEENKNHNGTIIYACSCLDCSKYLGKFVELCIEDKTESYLWALDAISNMDGPFESEGIANAISLVEQTLSTKLIRGKKPRLRYLLRWLKNISQRDFS
jgi:hypothetical protein